MGQQKMKRGEAAGRFLSLSSLALLFILIFAGLAACGGGAGEKADEIDSVLSDSGTTAEDSADNGAMGDSSAMESGESRGGDHDGADGGGSKSEPVLRWVFSFSELNGTSIPEGSVALNVNGRKYEIIPDAQGAYTELRRDQYHNYRVPDSALTAASGWWAGAGDVIYIARQGDQLVVKRRLLDEMVEDDGTYQEMMKLRIP